MLNLLGSLAYLAAAIACLAAAFHARAAPSRRVRQALVRHWLGLALLFVLLTVWRASGGEAAVQDWGRDLLHARGIYDARRSWQGPIGAAALLAAGCWIGWLAARNHRRIDPLVGWSRLAGLGLLGYSLLRLLSWHPVDAVIYLSLGPFLVNHVIDMGLTLFCGLAALLAARARFARPVDQGHAASQ
ncbi:MAG TPA: hypothetical protein PKD92_00040 [Novosphingobium sp.]|nr:hypothetical protein [Novosphingobium sp.]